MCDKNLFDYNVSEGLFPMTDEEDHAMRCAFVNNLGLLLKQTRQGIKKIFLDEEDYVHVVYQNDCQEVIWVYADSFTAIIRDVVKRL